MNELQEIEVIIGADGRLKVEVRGAKGPQCLTFTKEMEQLLGNEVVDRDLTFEYDAVPDETGEIARLKQGE